MVQAKLIKWGIILFILLGVVGGVWAHYTSLVKGRDEAVALATNLQVKNTELREELIRVTRDREELISATQKAAQDRERIRDELNGTIRRLRAQKPPQECTAAINWAVEQKADMDWGAK